MNTLFLELKGDLFFSDTMDRSSPNVRGRMNSTGSLAPLPDFSPQLPNDALLVADETRESVRRSELVERDVAESSVMDEMDMETAENPRDTPASVESDSDEIVSEISCKNRSVCTSFD